MSDTVLKDCAEDIPHLQVKDLKKFFSQIYFDFIDFTGRRF